MSSHNTLVISCGSSSIKLALVNEAHSLFPLHGLAERLDSRDAVLRWKRGGDSDSLIIPNVDHCAALAQLLPVTQNAAGGKLYNIGYRVVHGDELFTHAICIDDWVVEATRATAPLAPLHNPVNLQSIEAVMTLFLKLPHVAVFGTTFHQSLPEHAYRYTLPKALYHEHGVRRHGFYGTSHHYVSHHAVEMAGLTVSDGGWLSAHLDNGSSICTIVNGQSLDTSVGLTPLKDLVMGTRSGNVGLNLHSHLAWILGQSLGRIDSMLDNENDLLGLSDPSSDMRILEQEHEQGRPGAALVIEVFCYHLAKSLAAVSCVLPQLDGVTFIGGIGENSPPVHAKTAVRLQLFDLRLNQETNTRCMRGAAGPIQTVEHPRVLMIPTNEERQIVLGMLAPLD